MGYPVPSNSPRCGGARHGGRRVASCSPPFHIQVGEDLLVDVGILDARDHPHRPAAGWAGFDAEDALKALRPAHRGLAVDTQSQSVIGSPTNAAE